MDISRKEIGTLNELVKISLSSEDYQNQVETEIKKYQKSMNLPGFRPGHVPIGLIKKKYGKSILIEELNKIVSGSLEGFINENKLDILGSPIPQTSDSSINNWDSPGNFEFDFEIGLAPQFELNLPPAKTLDYYLITVDDKQVENYTDDIRRKYGKFSNPESADEQSILYGDFHQLSPEGEVLEAGHTNRSTLAIASITDSETKSRFIGTKKGDVVRINLQKAFGGNADEIAHMLNVPAEKLGEYPGDFNYTVDTVNLVEKADMTQEFFDKIYGPGIVSTEDEFKEKVRSEIAGMYIRESDQKLKHDLEDVLLDDLKISLPDEFLRKWLQTSVEKPLSPDQVEKEYNGYSRSMKLRLIENRIFRNQQMNITQDEIRDMAKQYILHQFAGYTSGLNEEMMTGLVSKYLEKRESVERIIETLSEQKVFNYLKSIVKTKEVSVNYEQFMEIIKNHQHH